MKRTTTKKSPLVRILASVLTVIMVAGMFPLNAAVVAFAAELTKYALVVTHQTSPIAGAAVTLTTAGMDPLQSTTGDDGVAEFEDLDTAKDYAYKVVKYGYADKTGTLDFESDPLETQVQLEPLAVTSVSGKVTDAVDNPLEAVAVTLTGYVTSPRNTVTAADGTFSFSNVYVGKVYAFTFESGGYKTKTVNAVLGGDNEVILEQKGSQPDFRFQKAGNQQVKFGVTDFENKAVGAEGTDAVTYTSSAPGIATVDSAGKITPVGIGTTTITAAVPETDDYQATTITYELEVIKGDQAELKFAVSAPAPLVYGDNTFKNTAKGGTGSGAITYLSNNTAVVTVSSAGVLTTVAAGTATITATKAGNAFYADISASYDIEVIKAAQAPLAFALRSPADILVDTEMTNTASGGTLGGEITYVSSNPGIAAVDADGKVTGISPGIVTVTATMAGDNRYKDVTATYSLTVLATDNDDLRFTVSNPGSIVFGEEFSNPVVADSGNGEGPVTYESSDETVATVDKDGKLTILKAGMVTVTANKDADSKFVEQTAQYTLVIEKAPQTLAFDPANPEDITYGQGAPELAAQGAVGNGTLMYAVTAGDAAEVDALTGALTINKAGTVRVTATITECDNYLSAQASYYLTILKAEQTVTFENGETPKITYDAENTTYKNAASSAEIAGAVFTYAITGGEDCVDDFNPADGSFTVIKAGTVTIEAAAAGNDRYNPAAATYTLTVNKADQTGFVFAQGNTTLVYGKHIKFTNAVSGGQTAEEPVYALALAQGEDLLGGKMPTIDEQTGEVAVNGVGTFTVTATKAGDDLYNPVTATYTLTVNYAPVPAGSYALTGETKNDSGWFTGNVGAEAAEDFLLSRTDTLIDEDDSWSDTLADLVTEDAQNTQILFYLRGEDGIAKVTDNAQKDAATPTVEIQIAGSFWQTLLEAITFGLYSNNKDLTVVTGDATSGVASVHYFITDSETPKSAAELDALFAAKTENTWNPYTTTVTDIIDQAAVVYARAEDKAGNVQYACTNGIILDSTAATVNTFVPRQVPNANGRFRTDIDMDFKVTDPAPSSGIEEIRYEAKKDGVIVKQGTVTPDDTREGIATEDVREGSFKVKRNLINSDNVVITLFVKDRAGNLSQKSFSLSIDATPPAIAVSYDNNAPYKTDNGRGYFPAARTATVVITERTSNFDQIKATQAIQNAVYAENAAEEDIYSPTVEGKLFPAAKISAWTTTEGAAPDDATHTATITYDVAANYTLADIVYTDEAGNANTDEEGVAVVDYGTAVTPKTFTVDKNKPTGTVTVSEKAWTQLLTVLTFGIWKNNDTFEVTIEADDETGPIESVAFFKTDRTTVFTQQELNAAEWQPYTGGFNVGSAEENQKFVIYAKITDYAGNTGYFCSDGHVYDTVAPVITTLTPDRDPNGNGNYNADVTFTLEVNDPVPYSGIKTVKYTVTSNGKVTQSETLYDFGWPTAEKNEVSAYPTYADLKQEFTADIVVNSALNNSDNVVLRVETEDNAGNTSSKTAELKVDITPPAIAVSYDNNAANKTDNDRGYFPAARTATVVITERTSNFDPVAATAGITVTAVNAAGEPVEFDRAAKISGWTTKEFSNEPADADKATHTATITYDVDANYTFDIAYTDKADNLNTPVDYATSVTPQVFTVDQTDPTGSVTVSETVWDTLLKVLTFGIWKNSGDFKVSVASADITSPIVVEYHRTDDTTIKAEQTLENLPAAEWKPYVGAFDINEDEKFVIYVRVTDYAGKRIYFCTDGHVYDTVAPVITTLAPDRDPNEHGNYKGDVTFTLKVNEPAPYSGIKTVKYTVTSNGKVTQSETLYDFGWPTAEKNEVSAYPTYADLKQEFTADIVVNSALNNSDNVVLTVETEDNAGNTSSQTVNLKIDITPPAIAVSYDNNTAYKTDNGRGYFPAARTATVVITERTSNFDPAAATAGITVTAVNAAGEPVEFDRAAKISGWTTKEFSNEPADADKATHTATITYDVDANYTFAIAYTDKADNLNTPVDYATSVTPQVFTVDQTAPTGGVTVSGFRTWDTVGTPETKESRWDTLINPLTFDLWADIKADVSSDSTDLTSPIESVSYHKTADTTAKTEAVLRAQPESFWTQYEPFTVLPNEQFVVYIRIVDYAGNHTYISTNGVIVDDTPPEETIAPDVNITPVQPLPEKGIYNGSAAFIIKVEDPTAGNTWSGINRVTYQVINFDDAGNEVVTQGNTADNYGDDLYNYSPAVGKEQRFEMTVTVDSALLLNNSNNLKIIATARDNAGNISSSEEYYLKIDTTRPEIIVAFTDEERPGWTGYDAYFLNPRKATITVTERNFSGDDIVLEVARRDDADKTTDESTTYFDSLNWRRIAPTDRNGDNTKYVAELTFIPDGDYTFSIACKDLAENVLVRDGVTYEGKNTGANSDGKTYFTVDRTNPVIDVRYSFIDPPQAAITMNPDSEQNYFARTVQATVTITEHNFDPSLVTLVVTPESTQVGENAPGVPIPTQWRDIGDNRWQSVVQFTQDGKYTFAITRCEDMAGNAAASFVPVTFTVDTVTPVLVLEGVNDQTAYGKEGNQTKVLDDDGFVKRGVVKFTLTLTDANIGSFMPRLVRYKSDGNSEEIGLEIGGNKESDKQIVEVKDLTEDGIYRLTCKAVDKAGNETENIEGASKNGQTSIVFSVNRDGPTFLLDGAFEKDAENNISRTYGFINNMFMKKPIALKISIINATELGSPLGKPTDDESERPGANVGVSKDNEPEFSLDDEGANAKYTFEKKQGADLDGQWYRYEVEVKESNFEKEEKPDDGDYRVTVYCRDKLDNLNNTDVIAESRMEFVIDSTMPTITSIKDTVSGKEITREGLNSLRNDKAVIEFTVDERELDKVQVLVNDVEKKDGEVKKVKDNMFSFDVEQGVHSITVKLIDKASEIAKTHTSITADEYSSDYKYEKLVISANILYQFFYNRALFFGSIGGIVLIGVGVSVLVFVKKRRAGVA